MKSLCDFSSRFRILKGGKISLVVSALLGSAVMLHAAPIGGVVTSGSATINQSGKVTNITQSTQKASINWQQFGIKNDETVNFNQPNVNSITLNRVVGNERSVIDGALNANGQVWILNSNGVLFGKNAKINTAGLLATTKDLSDQDFQAGKYNFKGDSTASVVNLGEIDISDSGYATLLANSVSNEGVIKAVKGQVHLVGANQVTINLNGNSIVGLTVDKGVLDALVENKGAVYADGGQVYLTTNAVNELLKGVVNNEGVVEANSLEGVTGHVELFAHGGEVKVGGTITAKDGFVETSGDKVKVSDEFRVKADKWLIDPKDFIIAASGGDITGATLSSNLENANVEIQSGDGATEGNGDIFVNDAISWGAATKLTLNAQNDIFINKPITATNEAGQLALYYGQGAVASENTADYYIKAPINLKAGDNFFTKKGSDGAITTWKVITDLGSAGSTTGTDLQGIKGNLSGNYVLGADIDAGATSSWNRGAGWTPIGDDSNYFTGNFDGLGHEIDGLTINRTNIFFDVGLFGYTNGATIKNIGLTNVNITGFYYVGGLVGWNDSSSITNSYATGTVTGVDYVGGLVGKNYNSSITDSYATGTVTGKEVVGGLVGGNYYSSSITNSYAAGTVTGSGYAVGGLVGYNDSSSITNSYATGAVTGTDSVGGLVGVNDSSSIANSYATGTVTGSGSNVGGLVGYNEYDSSITDSYATGTVEGTKYVGGLVGLNEFVSSITNSYATGAVTGTDYVGGLVGVNNSSITNSYYDKTVNTGMADEDSYGKTTEELNELSTFSEWDIEADPTLAKGYPFLAWQKSDNGYTKTWVIGTKVASTNGGTTPTPTPDSTPTPTPDSTPTPTPDSTPTPTPDSTLQIGKIITPIVNQEVITINPPNVETPNDIGKNFNVAFSTGENKQIVSIPIEGQANQTITLSQARQMQLENGVSGEVVRVPVSKSSIIEIVNGGVNLPNGVEQEFYVVESKEGQ